MKHIVLSAYVIYDPTENQIATNVYSDDKFQGAVKFKVDISNTLSYDAMKYYAVYYFAQRYNIRTQYRTVQELIYHAPNLESYGFNVRMNQSRATYKSMLAQRLPKLKKVKKGEYDYRGRILRKVGTKWHAVNSITETLEHTASTLTELTKFIDLYTDI